MSVPRPRRALTIASNLKSAYDKFTGRLSQMKNDDVVVYFTRVNPCVAIYAEYARVHSECDISGHSSYLIHTQRMVIDFGVEEDRLKVCVVPSLCDYVCSCYVIM
jgi:hypothetical protein